ncbi:MAG: Na+/H+ antiporter NhaC [Acidobacteriota bacterium]
MGNGVLSPRRSLSLTEALAPVVAMGVLFGVGTLLQDSGSELLVLVILGAAAVATVSAVRVGGTWDDVQRSAGHKLTGALPAIFILLAIGMLIGTWVLSGTIPAMVHLGLQLVDPRFLVLTAFLATAAMSLCTGTSWGSAGTLGVALMGMAQALDAPLAPVAGAVVSGAYFGDKLSPLSDSTNICAIGAGADLYRHVRHMLYTAGPSFLLASAVYGLTTLPAEDGGLPARAATLMADIERVYAFDLWLALPPLVVLVGIVARIPAAIAITASSAAAAAVGVWRQGFSPADATTTAVRGFDSSMTAALGVDPGTLGEGFRGLANRGGLESMAGVLLVVLAAFLLAGAMDVSGALDLLVRRLLEAARGTFGLIAATMAAGATTIGLTSHGGVTALIVGGLFQKAYADRGLAPEALSRTLEDSVTLVEPLMPWTVSAVFMATTLGVATVELAPWAVFCWGGPLFSLALAATYDRLGFGLRRLADDPPRPD